MGSPTQPCTYSESLCGRVEAPVAASKAASKLPTGGPPVTVMELGPKVVERPPESMATTVTAWEPTESAATEATSWKPE